MRKYTGNFTYIPLYNSHNEIDRPSKIPVS